MRWILAAGLLGATAGAAVFAHWAFHHGAPFIAVTVAALVVVNLDNFRKVVRGGRGAA